MVLSLTAVSTCAHTISSQHLHCLSPTVAVLPHINIFPTSHFPGIEVRLLLLKMVLVFTDGITIAVGIVPAGDRAKTICYLSVIPNC